MKVQKKNSDMKISEFFQSPKLRVDTLAIS